jgi:protein-tyrosine-phosphatase
MVEFKYAPATGEFRLMEINGRFWGSLPLAVAAGADFPAMLHELMTRGKVSDRPPARPDVLCRHLSRELIWLEHVLRKAAPPGLVELPSPRSVLRDCLMVFSSRHHFDVQAWRDPWPGLVDMARVLRLQWQRVSTVLRFKLRLAQAWRQARPAASGPRRVRDARHVLFLCYGNINRSALAHAYAQSHHAGRCSFQSAGFHAVDNRPADPTMVEEAATRGVDLTHWRSQTLTAEMVQRADAILVMEMAHLERLLQAHPQASGKAFLLGAPTASAMHQAEVADPYGQPRAEYARVCRQVLAAVDAWLQPQRI